MNIAKTKSTAAWLSVLSNTSLIIAKIVVGILINSVSVISEAIHSGVDLIASGIAVFAVHHAEKPADQKHPYGHGKAENISGTIEAILIFIAAAWIIYEAVKKLLHGGTVENAVWGIGVMLFSSIVNFIISEYLFKTAKKTDSVALEADAWHLRTDVYTSAGVFFGLALIWAGETIFPGRHFHWIDPVAAIIVALFIVHAAWELTARSSKDLLDRALPKVEEEWINDFIQMKRPVVCGFHYLRTRKAGSFRFVDFHLQVDRNMTVENSHALTDEVVQAIKQRFPRTSITIHIEPCDGSCKPICLSGCFLSETERDKYHNKIDGD
jgi:cation diffusion facilitator family transporter